MIDFLEMFEKLALFLVDISFVNGIAVDNPLVDFPISGGYFNIDLSDKTKLKGAQAFANLYINNNLNGKGGKSKNVEFYKVTSAKQQVVAGMNYAILFIVKKPNSVIKG